MARATTTPMIILMIAVSTPPEPGEVGSVDRAGAGDIHTLKLDPCKYGLHQHTHLYNNN